MSLLKTFDGQLTQFLDGVAIPNRFSQDGVVVIADSKLLSIID